MIIVRFVVKFAILQVYIFHLVGYDTDDVKRDNAVIRVYDGGKYIQLAFYNDGSLNYSTYDYYEKMGNDYEEMEHMPATGEHDRLGLYKKTPDYEEVKGKETKTQ
ncbi:hypothetical protein ABD69_04205 [Bacillus subtilis]|nr:MULTISPECIES: cystatin-like fold lipoprotein [Bacillus]MBG9805897.1 hypothetical protein [Bacillus subtilis]